MRSKPVHTYVVQVHIAQNHMSGKDTHVRGMKVFGPKEYVLVYFAIESWFLCSLAFPVPHFHSSLPPLIFGFMSSLIVPCPRSPVFCSRSLASSSFFLDLSSPNADALFVL